MANADKPPGPDPPEDFPPTNDRRAPGPGPDGPDPPRIGRYRVERVLGEGSYGKVYLAHDDELDRLVAIKVPHRRRIARPEDIDAYLAEARILAGLDSPGIVPVYDAGRTDDGLCYVVSKYVEGGDLCAKVRDPRPSPAEAAELVASVAEALHYAHLRGLVHRDIKPANILLDTQGRPYVADFGLALKEEDFGRRASWAGTPAYMSPEQAYGEGHRVDGRADIFSLGVVLYELLTGHRPFSGTTAPELFEQITRLDPRPLRMRDDTIPRELERICLKALAKRRTERYQTARDFADDLRAFIRTATGPARPDDAAPAASPSPAAPAPATPPLVDATPRAGTPGRSGGPSSDRPVKILPKGLRAFEARDADFFLELLPGPRDRDGVPESIRFWKGRIEETDPDKTSAVALIYGPSGCGKSSFVKAGLLPRLAPSVIVVYVEATPEGTEARLLRALRRLCPLLPADLGFQESVAALRRGVGLPGGKKVLVVIDQFEQWLHARPEDDRAGLAEALRQCDGEHVQCLLLVRDDFWMATARFMEQLEIRLHDGHSAMPLDLFDVRHTRRVLAAFGRAFGALPETRSELSKEQNAFLDQAAAGLAQGGRVVCVRLALFVEMMKGRPWTPAELHDVGGAEGVGVTFLEETFCGPAARPEHRRHEPAARRVLMALLPEPGTDLKGHTRSYDELLAASDYAGRREAFDELLHILDNELRLVTPTDPRGLDPEADAPAAEHDKHYQLTHDYLVPAVRQWATRRQGESRGGRAALRLAEFAAVWTRRPESRSLPSWWEAFGLWILTERRHWSETERKMMRAAGKHHALWAGVLAVLLAILGFAGYELYGRLRATLLVQNLWTARTGEVPQVLAGLAGYRRWAETPLRSALRDADDEQKRLYASLALLALFPEQAADPEQVALLRDRLLTAEAEAVPVLVGALAERRAELQDGLWTVLEDPNADPDRRLRAACALAEFTPDDPRWKTAAGPLASKLALENPLTIALWVNSLERVWKWFHAPLADLIEDKAQSEATRAAACDLFAACAMANPGAYAELEKRLAPPAEEGKGAALLPAGPAAGSPPKPSGADRKLRELLLPEPWKPSHMPGEAPLAPRPPSAIRPEPTPGTPRLDLPSLRDVPDVPRLLAPKPGTLPQPELIPLPSRLEPMDSKSMPDVPRLEEPKPGTLRTPEDIPPPARLEPLNSKDAPKALTVAEPKPPALPLDGWKASRPTAGASKEPQLAKPKPPGLPPGKLEPPKSILAPKEPPLAESKLPVLPSPKPLPAPTRSESPDSKGTKEPPLAKPKPSVPALPKPTPGPVPSVLPDSNGMKEPRLPEPELSDPFSSKTSPGAKPPPPSIEEVPHAIESLPRPEPLALPPPGTLERPGPLPPLLPGPAPPLRVPSIEVAVPPRIKEFPPAEDFVPSLPILDGPVEPAIRATARGEERANVAAALLRLGRYESVRTVLTLGPDPTVRSLLIHRSAAMNIGPQRLVEWLDREKEPSARQALVLALGEQDPSRLRPADRQATESRLLAVYREDPDPGVHAAAEWALGRWCDPGDRRRQETDKTLTGGKPESGRGWHLSAQGHTMLVVADPSPPTGGRTGGAGPRFAIASKEVTVQQYRRSVPGGEDRQTAPHLPVLGVSWYDAAEYCNWLSHEEGIPKEQWCYEANAAGAFAGGMKIRAGRTGYRLPTEHEWERACRAGTATDYAFGTPADLLGQYAWHGFNSGAEPHPVGLLKPNGLGLFDVHGNASEWCQDGYGDGPGPEPAVREVRDGQGRALRGGAYVHQPSANGFQCRDAYLPWLHDGHTGFRVARTLE